MPELYTNRTPIFLHYQLRLIYNPSNFGKGRRENERGRKAKENLLVVRFYGRLGEDEKMIGKIIRYPPFVQARIDEIVVAYRRGAAAHETTRGLYPILLRDVVLENVTLQVHRKDFRRILGFFQTQPDWKIALERSDNYPIPLGVPITTRQERAAVYSLEAAVSREVPDYLSYDARRKRLVEEIERVRGIVEGIDFGTQPPTSWMKLIAFLSAQADLEAISPSKKSKV